jgi:hypothetical protein
MLLAVRALAVAADHHQVDPAALLRRLERGHPRA